MANQIFTKAELKQMDIERRLAVVDILRQHTDRNHPVALDTAVRMCNGLTNAQELIANANRAEYRRSRDRGKRAMQAFRTAKNSYTRHFAELDNNGNVIANFDRVAKCTVIYAE